ncbi:MAG: hypothetical protein O7G85_13965 [Planctomycetota bacterium]|nr:hypothetical protein [Planctomycetota bacterium]
MKNTLEAVEIALEHCEHNVQVAATLVLADAVGKLTSKHDPLSHLICMVFRKGLFGEHADSGSSIASLMPD